MPPNYSVSGTLIPDATGMFDYDGELNGKASFRRPDGLWFLWWHPIGMWLINAIKGVIGGLKWEHAFPDIKGEYLPNVGAAGIATVTD